MLLSLGNSRVRGCMHIILSAIRIQGCSNLLWGPFQPWQQWRIHRAQMWWKASFVDLSTQTPKAISENMGRSSVLLCMSFSAAAIRSSRREGAVARFYAETCLKYFLMSVSNNQTGLWSQNLPKFTVFCIIWLFLTSCSHCIGNTFRWSLSLFNRGLRKTDSFQNKLSKYVWSSGKRWRIENIYSLVCLWYRNKVVMEEEEEQYRNKMFSPSGAKGTHIHKEDQESRHG